MTRRRRTAERTGNRNAAALGSWGDMVRVDGSVWCHDHGAVHDATTDPYDEVEADHCRQQEHRTIYYRSRKGDL